MIEKKKQQQKDTGCNQNHESFQQSIFDTSIAISMHITVLHIITDRRLAEKLTAE